MSPYWASARLRGIGVAVITRMSARSPLAPRSMRWRTPKRCCSSTTARRRSRKATSFWKSAWVPTRIGDLAGRQRRELGGALGALVAAGQDVEPDAGGLGERRERERGAGGRGSRSAPSAPPGRRPRRRRAWRGARPASCRRRRRPGAAGSSGSAEAMSAVISATRALLGAGGRVGQGGEHPGAAGGRRRGWRSPWRASSGRGRSRASPGGRGARHRRGARGRGRSGARSAGPVGRVGGPERGAASRASGAGASGSARSIPAAPGSRPRASWTARVIGAQRQPLGQRVDRLERRQGLGARRGGARGRGGPSGRCRRRSRPGPETMRRWPAGKVPAQPVGARVEEDELELGQRVADVDAVRPAARSPGAGAGRPRPRR